MTMSMWEYEMFQNLLSGNPWIPEQHAHSKDFYHVNLTKDSAEQLAAQDLVDSMNAFNRDIRPLAVYGNLELRWFYSNDSRTPALIRTDI